MSLPDDVFLEKIPDDILQKKYFAELRKGTHEIKKAFHAEKSKRKINYEEGIETRQTHDELVNLGIFPFIQNYPPKELGYKLKYCDPLYEEHKLNFDFLIIREEKGKATLIFGEAKIDRDGFDAIAQEVLNKIAVVNSSIPTLEKSYINSGNRITHIEYVILIRGQYVDKMRSALEKAMSEEKQGRIDKETRIIIWKADLNESCLERAEPGYNNKFYERMIHADGKLNSRLNNLQRNGPNVLDLFPQSHVVKKLEAVVKAVISNKARMRIGKASFTLNDLRQILENELGYIQQTLHASIIEEITREGVEIGLIEKLDANTYKIKEAYSGSSLNAKGIKKLWVNYRIKKELQKRLETMRVDVQTKIAEEYRVKPRSQSLEKWFGQTGASNNRPSDVKLNTERKADSESQDQDEGAQK